MSRIRGLAGRSSCARYQPALTGLAEQRLPGVESRAALEHVERCPDCARELGELMLTVVVLRRMAAEAATVEQLVPDDAWNRLRARIERSRRRARAQAWQWRATLGGMATATMLVAVLIGPAAVHVTDRTSLETDAASIARLTDRVETQLEEARLNNLRKNSAGSSARTIDGAQTAGSVPRWHPAEDEGGALSPITIVAPTSRPTGFHPI